MKKLQHRFVEFIPDEIEEGILYVSVQYCTAIHKCACGCKSDVVTPISPTDWKLTFDGDSISLHPSIGNWSYPCRSHYWITNNKITFARQWSNWEVSKAVQKDTDKKKRYFKKKKGKG